MEVASESAIGNSIDLLKDFFSAELGPYTVLEYTIAAFGIAAVIGGVRWAYRKALGKQNSLSIATT